MAGHLSLGWHAFDPGPGPRSHLLDAPPAIDGPALAQAHQQWRAAVETDEDRLLQQHLQQPMWHPVVVPDHLAVLPAYGGTADALGHLIATLTLSGLESGVDRVRVVNLSGWALDGPLRTAMSRARNNRLQIDVVSRAGSSYPLLGSMDADDLVALVVDSVRATTAGSAQDALRDRQLLLRVVGLLEQDPTPERLVEALDVALGAPAAASFLTVTEHRALRDFHDTVVSPRRGTIDRLTDLQADVSALAGFGTLAASPTTIGAGQRLSVRWVDAAGSTSPADAELARAVVGRTALKGFAHGRASELMVVAGAERLADDVLEEMTDAAERLGKTVALLFTKFTDSGQRVLGRGGSRVAIFLRLPHHQDALVAADFLGREYTFVVNGHSIADGDTEEWSSTYGTSSSRSRSYSRSSSNNSSYGLRALSFGRSIGSSISSSFSHEVSTSATAGKSHQTTTTTSTGRVHEHVIEPTVFQSMDDRLMFITGRATVTLASCDSGLRRSPQLAQGVLELT